jgi:hypothetical protein
LSRGACRDQHECDSERHDDVLTNRLIRVCAAGKVKPLTMQSPLSARGRFDILAAQAKVCEWVEVYNSWRPNPCDGADNHLMEPAVAGVAAAPVTNHVKDLVSPDLIFPSIRIIAPAAFVKELR